MDINSKYHLLGSDEEICDTRDRVNMSNPRLSLPTRSWMRPKQPLISRQSIHSAALIIISSISLAFVFVAFRDWLYASNTYESGFNTDIVTPFKIPLVEVRSSGSPTFLRENHMEMPPLRADAVWPENVTYVGNPSQQEERIWDKLVTQASFPITVQEARHSWPDHYQEYYLPEERKYRAAMEMFHTLHCVNVMRRLASPEVYGNDIDPHVHHCIEILRQHVMCYGSTTLIPTKWEPNIQQGYIDSDQVHTCRDFNTLHSYMLARQDPTNPLYVGIQPRE